MTPYRFSPVQNIGQLMKTIAYIHTACHRLCSQSLERYLPVAGNIGIFCHYDDEYALLTEIQSDISDSSKRVYGKYFRLYTPFVIPAKNDIPRATYTHLYIRKPDLYKHQVGDLDFYMESREYHELKQSLTKENAVKGARILDRPDLDLVELYDKDIDALGYIGDKSWVEST